MKRIVLGVVVSLGVFALACSGGGGGGTGPNCTKYLKCCDATSEAASCDTAFGANSSCNVDSATMASCETTCDSDYAGEKTAALLEDAGNSTACP